MSSSDDKWTRDVRLTLDWSAPLDALLPLYDQAAEIATWRAAGVLVRSGVAMRDPFNDAHSGEWG